jgi:hypothetical protein
MIRRSFNQWDMTREVLEAIKSCVAGGLQPAGRTLARENL